jgi:hypothetical protein
LWPVNLVIEERTVTTDRACGHTRGGAGLGLLALLLVRRRRAPARP